MNFEGSNYRLLQEEYSYWAAKVGGANASDISGNTKHFSDLLSDRTGLPLGVDRRLSVTLSALRSDDPAYNNMCIPDARDKHPTKPGEMKDGFNTTNHLNHIGNRLRSNDITNAKDTVQAIKIFLEAIIKRETSGNQDLEERLLDVLKQSMGELLSIIDLFNYEKDKVVTIDRDVFIVKPNNEYVSLTSYGEGIAALFYEESFKDSNIDAQRIDLSFLQKEIQALGNPEEVLSNIDPRKWAREKIVPSIANQMKKSAGARIHFTGGYVPNRVQRGYSDVTSADTATAAKLIERQVAGVIEKQFSIHSADPRYVENTQAIPYMNAGFARQAMVAANVEVVEVDALDVFLENEIPLFVFDPKNTAETTVISDQVPPSRRGIDMAVLQPIQYLSITGDASMIRKGVQSRATGLIAESGHSIGDNGGTDFSLGFTFAKKSTGNFSDTQKKTLIKALNDFYGESSDMEAELGDRVLLHLMGNHIGNEALKVLHEVRSDMGIEDNELMLSHGNVSFVIVLRRSYSEEFRKRVHEKMLEYRKG